MEAVEPIVLSPQQFDALYRLAGDPLLEASEMRSRAATIVGPERWAVVVANERSGLITKIVVDWRA